MLDLEGSPRVALDFNGISLPLSCAWDTVLRWHSATTLAEVRPALEAVWADCQAGYEAVGWVSYEAAPAFDSAFPSLFIRSDEQPPLVVFAVVDPKQCLPRLEKQQNVHDVFPLTWVSGVNKQNFQKQLESVQDAIRAGETYQVNLTQRLSAHFSGNPWVWYQQLRQEQQAGYNAFIRYNDWAVLSCSPELFFEWDGKANRVTAKPMKGTVARAPDAVGDKDRAVWLYESEKNRAENVMIVDLLRNDLAKVASKVKVPHLFDLERYSTVWQMTSTIDALMKPNTTWVDVLAALFPCGSVVGAPKLKTAEHIARLEGVHRGVYCGAVGWVSADRAVFNVPIRTVQWNAVSQKAVYGVGNGLTIDSNGDEEWREIEAKCHFLTQKTPEDWALFETLYWSHAEGFRYMDEHLQRMAASAEYWGWVNLVYVETLQSRLKDTLSAACMKGQWIGAQRIKLMLGPNLRVEAAENLNLSLRVHVEAQPWSWSVSDVQPKVILAKKPIPVDMDRRWLCHKTTQRALYEAMCAEKPEWAWDVLLWNAEGELTEFSRGNVALELDGTWYTPPVACGLLPGIERAKSLELGQLHERKINRELLEQATRLAFLNSLRGWVPVTWCKEE